MVLRAWPSSSLFSARPPWMHAVTVSVSLGLRVLSCFSVLASVSVWVSVCLRRCLRASLGVRASVGGSVGL